MHKGIYKAKNGTWYIHTTVKGKTITVRGFKSQRDADINYDFEVSKRIKSYDSEYKAVANEYLEYRSKKVRAESLRKDITQFNYFDVIFANDVISNVFNINRLKIIYNNVISNNKFSSQKKMRLILAFREFAKYCYQTNRISEATLNEVLLVFVQYKEDNRPTKAKRYIPQTHINAILNEVIKDNDNLFYLAVFVLYSSGLRISEMLGLIGADIDMNKKCINIQRQLLTNGKITTTLKTKKSYRSVPMTKELFDLFKKFKLMPTKRIFEMSHTSFKRKLAMYEQRANVPNYSAHEFRHTFCTNLASKCSNISEATYCATVSGHSVSIFLNTYCKSLNDDLKDKFFEH